MACARRVGSVSICGSSAQRPAVSGGPVRAGRRPRPPVVDDMRTRGGGRRLRWLGVPARVSARSGVSVSLLIRPDQTSSHSAEDSAASLVDPTPSASCRKNQAPPGASASSTAWCRSACSNGCGSGRVSGAWSARCSETQPSAPGSAAWPAQMHLAGGGELVEVRRLVVEHPRPQHQRLQRTGRHRAPGELVDRDEHPVHPAQAAAAPPSGRPSVAEPGETCCQAARNRPRASGSTGSTSLRSRASERRRSLRSTSASHHSEPDPAGRNSPSSTRPCAASRWRVWRTTAAPSPSRSATWSVVNGPWVRANRETRSASGSSTGSVNASGVPGGTGTPSPSRSRPMSSTAVQRASPAIRTSTTRRTSARAASHWAASAPSTVRSATSTVVSGPSIRSRSATPSASRARRSGASRWSSASTSASTSGSRSSRSSARPSSSASRPWSSESAAARRSAMGESPS